MTTSDSSSDRPDPNAAAHAPQDAALALAAGTSRDEALPALVDAHGGRLYQLALRFCGNREEAEDLVQETFLNAWKAWDDFEGRSSPATWLYTIASRACQRAQRKRSGEPERVDSLDEPSPGAAFGEPRLAVVPSGDAGPLAERIRAEDLERAETAIAALPELFRKPLVLKEIAGFSLAQVSEVLGVPEATLKTRLHRARLRLKQALDEGLPRADVPPAIFGVEVCLDLLDAKQEALDRGAEFTFPDGVVCERCATVFATLDYGGEVCRQLSRGELPEGLREELLRPQP